ncbi:hypothetical protein [Motiliproteus sp. MSK22-1]|uniref:hypothetical protein n=1 Tax=Motiliproteus sp. MSK22-1 TaxID=1897630 RepID=UPI0009788690|nr:hypothetical protein [Motiliproteus sp. MSK22-1]OMH38901.1 hypothetical protein BGP75_00560 [Motiliproteus sp. MSK22-1]
MTTDATDEIVLDSDQQAKLWKEFAGQLTGKVKESMETGTSQSDPLAMSASLASILREAGNFDTELIEAIEELSADSEVLAEINKFQEGLNGNEDISTVGVQPPVPEEPPAGDDGLNGRVILGEEGDLLRYSNYMSDSGTRFGGFVKDVPKRISKLIDSSLGLRLSKVDVLKEQWQKTNKYWNREVAGTLQHYRVGPGEMFPEFTSRQWASLPRKNGLTVFQRRENALASIESQILKQQSKNKGVTSAASMFKTAGKGVKGISALYGIAQGAIGTTVGSQHDKDMRLAGGVLGMATGVTGIMDLFNEKIATKYAAKVTAKSGAAAGEAALKKAGRFIPVAGMVVGVAAGVHSITANAMAADEARRQGNHGRAAMYGVMATLDSVALVLDVVSGVLDLLPGVGTAISFVVDIISTVLGVFSDLIGFFTHMVDTRTEEEKLQESFDEYIGSDGFKSYLDNMATAYTDQGYDVFKYAIDSKGADLDGSEDAHNKIEAKEYVRDLTNKAKAGLDELRLAVVDNTWRDDPLIGGMLDDLLDAQGGGSKNLFGHDGDDRLYASEHGSHNLYGGEGNDYLYSPLGYHKLYGEEGDDILVGTPGITAGFDGGPGIDTVVVNGLHGGDSWNYYDPDHGLRFAENSTRGQSTIPEDKRFFVNGAYIDLANKSAGFQIDPDYLVEKGELQSALQGSQSGLFSDNGELQQLKSLARRGGLTNLGTLDNLESLIADKNMWFLGRDASDTTYQLNYFTDGEYLYEIELFQGQLTGAIVDRSSLKLQDISDSIVTWETQDDPGLTRVTGGFYDPSKKVESLLYLYFSRTEFIQDVENVVLDIYGGASLFGDDKNNVINIGERVSGGILGDTIPSVIDGRDGDDTIVLKRQSTGDDSGYSVYLSGTSVYGGEGRDTLILSSADPASESWSQWRERDDKDYNYSYVLLDVDDAAMVDQHDWDLDWDPTKVNGGQHHVLRTNSIESIVLDDRGLQNLAVRPIELDATRIDTSLTITSQSRNQVWIESTRQTDQIRVINAGDNSRFVNLGGDDSLDFSPFKGSTGVNVDLSAGTITGAFSATLDNFDNVLASQHNDTLTGNDKVNKLVAFGGQDNLSGGGESDQLFSRRGQHHLDGGAGTDAYTIEGSVVTERVAINVLKEKDHGAHVAELDVSQNTRMNQDLSNLVAGEQVQLRFDYASRVGSGTGNGMRVLWNGVEVFSRDGDTGGWNEYSLTLTAQDGGNQLSFEGTGSSDGLGHLIDNVSVTNDLGRELVTNGSFEQGNVGWTGTQGLETQYKPETYGLAEIQLTAGGLNGVWNDNQLILDVLAQDRNQLQLMSDSIQIVDEEGNVLSGKGTISVVGNQLVFDPGSDFDGMERHDQQTFYVQYQSSGSTATLDDSGLEADILRTGYFTATDQIHFDIDQNGNLQVKDDQDNLVFTDLGFGKAIAAGMTDLLDLARDFSKRFPQWALSETDIVLDADQIFDLVSTGLEHKATESTGGDRSSPDAAFGGWDRYLVTSLLGTQTIGGWSGNDVLVSDTYGLSGGSGESRVNTGAGDDVVIVNEGVVQGGGSSNRTAVHLEGGSNTVIVGNQQRQVDISLGQGGSSTDRNTLVFDGITPDQLNVVAGSQGGFDIYVEGSLIATTLAANVIDSYAFKGEDRTIIIKGSDAFASLGSAGGGYDYYEFLDADEQRGLHFTSLSPDQLNLDIQLGAEGIIVGLNYQGSPLHSVHISNLELATLTELDLGALAVGLAMEVPAGIEFSDSSLTMAAAGEYFIQLLQDSSRHTLPSGVSLVDKGEAGYSDELSYLTALASSAAGEGSTGGDAGGAISGKVDVAIQNASFEDKLIASDRTLERDVPHWNISGGNTASFKDEQGFGVDGGASEGSNLVQINNGGSISQTLAATFDSTADYQLSVDLANYRYTVSDVSVRLWAGSTLLGSVDLSATQVQQQLGYGSWHTLTMDVDGAVHSAADDETLRIEVANPDDANGQWNDIFVDNLSLAKLTGAMATFDTSGSSAGGTAVNQTPFTLEPVLTAAV